MTAPSVATAVPADAAAGPTGRGGDLGHDATDIDRAEDRPSEGMPIVPVGLRVEGRRVVVVGAGRIAARKAAAYVDRGAAVVAVAPEHGPQMWALDPVERHHRRFRAADLDEAWFVVAATGDPAVDGAVFREAERRRIWCNAADDPAHCSVILPAVSRGGPITISVSSGGTSPATASWLRRRIDRFVAELLDERTEAVTAVASRVRRDLRNAGLPTEVPGWARVLDEDALDLVDRGRVDELEQRLRWAVRDGSGA